MTNIASYVYGRGVLFLPGVHRGGAHCGDQGTHQAGAREARVQNGGKAGAATLRSVSACKASLIEFESFCRPLQKPICCISVGHAEQSHHTHCSWPGLWGNTDRCAVFSEIVTHGGRQMARLPDVFADGLVCWLVDRRLDKH